MEAPSSYPGWPVYRRLLAERFGFEYPGEPLEKWYAWRGHALHFDIHEPEGEPRGTLVLVHGAGQHGRLLAPLGIFATSLGWRSVAPDLPGYGITRCPPHWRADYADWPECIAEIIRAQTGPVVVMGLSFGGMTALRAAQMAPNTGGVIATTLVDLCDAHQFLDAARRRWLARLSIKALRLAPWAMDGMRLRMDWMTALSHMSADPELARWFRQDSLVGRRTVQGRFFRSLQRYQPQRGDLSLPCPLLLAHPGADTWTPFALSEPLFAAIPGPKQLHLLAGGSHMPSEPDAWLELCETMGTFLREAEA